MSVIVIVGNSSSGEREFAEAIAARLGYTCVQPEVVVERAAALGCSQSELRAALEEPPRAWRRLSPSTPVQLTLLRAALTEEIRLGNAVCYGNLGLLLPRVQGVLRIRVERSEQDCSTLVSERLKLTRVEAGAWLRGRDRAARAWRRWVCGPDYGPRLRGDFSVDLATVSVESACDAIACIVRARPDGWVAASQALRALAKPPDMGHWSGIDPSGRALRVESPLAWAAATAVVVLGLSYAVMNAVSHRPGGAVRTFTGVITDTRCAGHHATGPESAAAECARRCVRDGPGVSFALDDGKALYVLADQASGDRFAGRRVTVVGLVDRATKMLKAQSIGLL